MSRRNLSDVTSMKALAEKLEKYQCVRRHDTATDRQGWTMAHAFSDIEESAMEMIETCLPQLQKARTEEEVFNVLHDIGEELRHILYHINDMAFYSYLRES